MDAYHCVFRLMAILSELDSIEIDKARIIDFYLVFPSAMHSVRFPNSLRSGRKIADIYRNPYRDAINPPITFRSLADIQAAAVKCIAGSGLIELENLKHSFLRRTEITVSDALRREIDEYKSQHMQLTEFLFKSLSSVPLLGQDGLKHRTSLMEYRYDNA